MGYLEVGNETILGEPFLGHPVEICIVTSDIKATLTGLCRFGIGPFKIFRFDQKCVTEQTFYGEAASFELDVAFATQNSMIWEVMQPVSGPSIMRDLSDSTNGRGGIHHVAFDCAERHESSQAKQQLVGAAAREEELRRRKEFEDRGFPVVMSGVWHGQEGTCEFQFFDTEAAVGTCFETYVFSDEWEEPAEERFP